MHVIVIPFTPFLAMTLKSYPDGRIRTSDEKPKDITPLRYTSPRADYDTGVIPYGRSVSSVLRTCPHDE